MTAREPDERLTFSVRLSSGTPVSVFRECALAAEELGFDQIWTGNDLLRRSGIVPVTVALTATSRIRVGSSVLNPVSLHPAEIAMIAAQLQDISHGRYLLGLGAGSEVFLRWAGLEPARPVPRTREGLRAVRALLEGRVPEGWHEQARLKDGPALPTPIYLGAMGPKMLALAGREADGALALCLPPDRIEWFSAQIDEGRGGRTDPFDLACCLWVSIDDDREAAKRRLASKIAPYAGSLAPDTLEAAGFDVERFAHVQALMTAGDTEAAIDAVDEAMLRLGMAGDVNDVTERCEELVSRGVHHLSFGQPLGASPVQALTLLGRHVLPALRPT
ncbi:LLM class flavin-dependent oxidoreductase [Kineosporia sp. NBRC 101731]|uniref:LLM class flavin-dependent oxidoreductase n=1 Tax=Kineosporia sp. NBRC 101731 TaxID=3032199 RepID=UPI0024A499E8|nr:LLM class flavin-dependent oxidoreductase [Kineosporia sp. NBRC 101731]GLY31027.1 LLM class F420-dependent oxidoreductase [Kineosporia sp. NBRC 101731]